MVLDHETEYRSRWAVVSSIAAKIGCSPATLHEWAKKTEVDIGERAGLPCDVGEKMKALERENRRLKRMYADLSMKADRLKEALGKK